MGMHRHHIKYQFALALLPSAGGQTGPQIGPQPPLGLAMIIKALRNQQFSQSCSHPEGGQFNGIQGCKSKEETGSA